MPIGRFVILLYLAVLTIHCQEAEEKENDLSIDNTTVSTPLEDTNTTTDAPTAEELKGYARHKSRCHAGGGLEGACLSGEECFRKGGQTSGPCAMNTDLQCCTFLHTCGDVSSEKVTYFRSPGYPSKSVGSLACDFDIVVQNTACAIRVEYQKVSLARKLGGMCDIDQLFILNSVDGPTAGQCGPLSGYSTSKCINML